MDLREYYGEIRQIEKNLEKKHGSFLHITSVKNREKNSTPGRTNIATPYNAARGIVDETHREATEEEVKAFYQHQEHCRLDNMRSEARKKKEVVVVMDRGGNNLPEESNQLVEDAIAAANSGRRSSAPMPSSGKSSTAVLDKEEEED